LINFNIDHLLFLSKESLIGDKKSKLRNKKESKSKLINSDKKLEKMHDIYLSKKRKYKLDEIEFDDDLEKDIYIDDEEEEMSNNGSEASEDSDESEINSEESDLVDKIINENENDSDDKDDEFIKVKKVNIKCFNIFRRIKASYYMNLLLILRQKILNNILIM
jgi:hypothetical protein